MKISDIFCDTFEALRRQVTPEVRLASCIVPDPLMVTATRSDDSDFCRETVEKGWLSEEQMAHAAERYRLGRSRSGKCIFWMIDELGRVHDGRIGDSWVSMMLRSRKPELLRYWQSSHCLFGLHLINDTLRYDTERGSYENENQNQNEKPNGNGTRSYEGVSVVEREESAVILSEVLPEQVWMATGRPADFTIDMLLPLRGHPIMVFPPTDPTMSNFVFWLEMADQARRQYHLDIEVNPLLEDKASAEEKERKIDVAEFICATKRDATKRSGAPTKR